MDIETIRDALNDWALLIAGVLGVIAAWEKAKRQVGKWWGTLNLFGRVRRLEERVDEIESECV